MLRVLERQVEEGDHDEWKEPRNLYIMIDEASTHVCMGPSIVPKFRIIFSTYNAKYKLLGTAISSSTHVLDNNDPPLGVASFNFHFNLQGMDANPFIEDNRYLKCAYWVLLQCMNAYPFELNMIGIQSRVSWIYCLVSIPKYAAVGVKQLDKTHV